MRWRRSRSWWPLPPGTHLRSATFGRVTAKKTDFYLDPLGQAGTVAHLSVHGSNERFDGHRFHIKVDRRLAATVKGRGYFMGHGVPRKGFTFDGQQLAVHAFRVARIRWTWDLQRPCGARLLDLALLVASSGLR